MRNIIKLVTAIILVIIVGLGIFIYCQKTKKNFLVLKLPEIKVQKEKVENTDYRWTCGSLHNHIMIFEDEKQNIKSLEEVIAASKKLGFKFIMLSEKGPAYNKNSKGWLNMIKECDKDNGEDFVCLSGQENCTLGEASKKPKGHFVIVENKNYIPEILDIPEVLKEAHKQGSIVIVAHPFYKKDISDMYNYDRWDILDWEAMEVQNGVIDQEANEQALKKIYELWNKGIKKSLTGGADFKNHKAYTDILLDPGEVENKLKTGYTCLYLDKLDRENIIKAIKEGRGYASSGVLIKEFSINSAMMGEKISVEKGENLNIKIDLEASGKIDKVMLIENGEILKKFEQGSKEFVKDVLISSQNSGWYGLEVYAEKGERAFANAIWVEVKNKIGKTK